MKDKPEWYWAPPPKEGVTLDLFTDHEARVEYEQRRLRYRDDTDQDWRNPGRYTRLRFPGAPIPDQRGTRCGRCGKPCAPYDLIINHDRGYGGCGGDSPVVEDEHGSREASLCDRADREAFPDCARCGHPWGLHTSGGGLPQTQHCYAYCGCMGYVAPDHGKTPWGTCPGCWGEPHAGDCPPVPKRGELA